jgi:hypothetical protein
LSRELTLAHKLCTYTQYWVIKRTEGRKEVVRALVETGAYIDQALRTGGVTPLVLCSEGTCQRGEGSAGGRRGH